MTNTDSINKSYLLSLAWTFVVADNDELFVADIITRRAKRDLDKLSKEKEEEENFSLSDVQLMSSVHELN